MKNNHATAITFFFSPRAVIDHRKNGKYNFIFSNLRTFFPRLNEKYYIPFEREFIQEENATKFKFLYIYIYIFFFFFNIYVNVTQVFFFFYHITQ